MRDVLLFICVAVFMIFGFFTVSKAGDFLDRNYKGFEQDEYQNEKNTVQKIENTEKPL